MEVNFFDKKLSRRISRELETEKAESSRKMELLEHDIQRALARIRDLEADNEALSKVREDNAHKQAQITRLQEQMASDKEAHEKGRHK